MWQGNANANANAHYISQASDKVAGRRGMEKERIRERERVEATRMSGPRVLQHGMLGSLASQIDSWSDGKPQRLLCPNAASVAKEDF